VLGILCCQCKFAKAQTIDTLPNIVITEPPDNGQRIFGGTYTEASYPGGPDKMFKYLDSAIIYPVKALKHKIGGKVFMAFVIEKDGHLTNIRAIRSPSDELANECIRVLKDIVFKPAKYVGQPRRVMYTMPIVFDADNPKVHH